jgi:probable HAF family extracellular repeat protein
MRTVSSRWSARTTSTSTSQAIAGAACASATPSASTPRRRYAASANAINDAGQIVGSSATNANIGAHAVLWNDRLSTPIDLNDYLDMNDVGAGWVLPGASGVNNKGWIVGTSQNTLTGQSHGFLLSLVPERDGHGHSGSSRRGVFCDSDL